MSISAGVGLAFAAMLCWGFGDFLIQRSTRKIGDWETLFVVCLFGAIVLLPFVWPDLHVLDDFKVLAILFGCSLVLFIAALLDFEALKEGKLSVVEPIWSFEVPAASLLAFFVLGEKVSPFQVFLISFLIVGLILVSVNKGAALKRFFMERGVILAFVAAFSMGAANFLLGWGSREGGALLANFFLNVFIVIATAIYLFSKGRFKKTLEDAVRFRALLLPMSISDNVAWIAYSFSMTLIPIAVATALSESYIIIAVILGIFVNKEKLQGHQKIGLSLAVISAIALAAISS